MTAHKDQIKIQMLTQHDNAIKKHTGFNQSTHKEEVDTSIGQAIIKLMLCYGSYSSLTRVIEAITNKRALISTALVDSTFEALSLRVHTEIQIDKDLLSAWTYVKSRLSEPLGEWDIVQTAIDNEEIKCIVSLKEALVLVYKALVDVTVFGAGEKDEALRLKTLWNCFKSLQKKGHTLCHHGIRQDVILTLDGVYPGIAILIDVPSLILTLMTEYLEQKIESFKNTQHYRTIVLTEIEAKSRHPLLEKSLSKDELRQIIKNRCLSQGVSLSLYQKIIDDNLACLDEVALTWESSTTYFALKTILQPHPVIQRTTHSLPAVKEWIMSQFNFDDPHDITRIKNYASILKAQLLIFELASTLKLFGEEYINSEAHTHFESLLAEYETGCINFKIPQIKSPELKQAITVFKKTATHFKADSSTAWIENFFARFITEENKPLLFEQFLSKTMQDKYRVDDSFLKTAFPSNQKEIPITPYIINRLFLHALSVAPYRWDKAFYDIFKQVVTFTRNKFVDSENTFCAMNLSLHSYPHKLLYQLSYLEYAYLHYSHGKENDLELLKADDCFIPMAHWIKSYKDLVSLLKQKPNFIVMWLKLIKENLPYLIQTPEQFGFLFGKLSDFDAITNEQSKDYLHLYDAMQDKIVILIPDGNALLEALSCIKLCLKPLLIECLGIKCKTIITNSDELAAVLEKISGYNGQYDARAYLLSILSEKILTLVSNKQEFKKMLQILDNAGQRLSVNGRFKSDYCVYLESLTSETSTDVLSQEKEGVALIENIIDRKFSFNLQTDKEMSAIKTILESPQPDLKKIGLIAHTGGLVHKLSFWGVQEQLQEKKIFFKLLSPLRLDNANTAQIIEGLQTFMDSHDKVHTGSIGIF